MSSTPSTPESWSHDFGHILSEELDRIRGEDRKPGETPTARAHREQLVGLAFSGGGIRSATFNLGVLQSLARMKLLSRFNYLSSVSGGGYIASWLMAWIYRRGAKDVRENLDPAWVRQPGHTEAPEIHFLRRFSNYLTPKLGWLGADMWTVIAIYIRNLILNLAILAAALSCVLLAPRWVALKSVVAWQATPFLATVLVALGCLLVAIYAITRSMRYFHVRAQRIDRNSESIDYLDRKPGWRSAAGVKMEPDELTAANARGWFFEELFDEFILRVKFEITGPGHGCVYVLTPRKDGTVTPDVCAAQVVHVSSSGPGGVPTGTINAHKPARRAPVKPGWNDLEISCAKDICTVRVNDLTINTLRVVRQEMRGPIASLLRRRSQGAIGFSKDAKGVNFQEIAVEKIESPSSSGGTQGDVQRWIVAPLFVAAFLATFLFGYVSVEPRRPYWLGDRMVLPNSSAALPWSWWKCALVAGGVSALFVFIARVLLAARHRDKLALELRQIVWETGSTFAAAAIGGALARGLYFPFQQTSLWEVMVWGTPALMGAFFMTIVLHIGFLGRKLRDERREWWSRLSAWLLIYSLGWAAIFGLAFYAPAFLRWATHQAPVWLSTISAGWILSTLSGLIAARSAATGKQKSNAVVEALAKAAPYIFVVGFFILLSWAVDALIGSKSNLKVDGSEAVFAHTLEYQWTRLAGADQTQLRWLTLGSLFVAVVLSWRLDINQFSMHMLYRNRLGRCYLGASNRLRQAQPFTGFSADDDVDLVEFSKPKVSYSGQFAAPYPIINAALNLVGGKELAWQQRKAASFVFTPLYCGYDFAELPPGYCPTEEFAKKPPPAISLATAMAISGAAASPNMGYHTSPAPAFLMTVFNVRLGWWLGNPRRKHGYKKSGPLIVLWSLICELFGLTSDEGRYIYLSDGGHFENLGIYELVRRRCRFIVACDAEEDHRFGFGGLGNAIEKCRADFGVDIDIDVEPIRRRSENGHSQWHCAIGKIYYTRVDEDARDGILVYLKSSLTGDEPTDALRYAAANPAFPHQSTADQWFDESQFESYRVLGFHIAQNVFAPLGDAESISKLTNEQVFVGLAQHWYPPSAATAESFTKHTRTVVRIYEQLRENRDLAFLSQDIYPEWHVLFEDSRRSKPRLLATEAQAPLREQLPKTDAELRAGFYLCNSVFQLFEDVYVDLLLEEEFDHPDNRGWMNFFRHWSWAPMFRVAWTISGGTYGARFQSFCERHLDLTIGRTKCTKLDVGSEVNYFDPPEEFKWTPQIAIVAEKIVQAIWTWLAELSVGSEIIAQAALTATTEEAQVGRSNANPHDKLDEDKVVETAKSLIRDALDRAKAEGKIYRRKPSCADEEWYAAATLLELIRRRGGSDELPLKWATAVAELALSHAITIAARALAEDFRNQLNETEREFIELLFIFNPSLAASARIFRLEIAPDTPGAASPSRTKGLDFPFGFAILAKTDALGANGPPKLVCLRVQDHLRRMGLARQALKNLIASDDRLQIDLKKMHPDAHEVPGDDDRGRLLRLYDSVRTEAQEKLGFSRTNFYGNWPT